MEKMDKRQTAFVDHLLDAGIRDGVAVPVFGAAGSFVYFGPGSTKRRLDLRSAEIRDWRYKSGYGRPARGW